MTKAELEKENQELKLKEKFIHKLKEVVIIPRQINFGSHVRDDYGAIALCTCGYAARVSRDGERRNLYDHYLEANAKEEEKGDNND